MPKIKGIKSKGEYSGFFILVLTKYPKPTHKIEDDTYDESYFKLQKDLVYNAYKSIRCIRLILTNHPKAKTYNPPEWLQKGRII